MTDQIGVIGAGAWGTTLAVRLADAQRPITLWAHSQESAENLAHARENQRYLPGVILPPNVRIATDDAYLAEPHRLFVLAVPSAHLRATVVRLRDQLSPDASLLSVVKGIEEGTHLRPSEVIEQELPGRRLAVLSGPNLAREIADGKPAGSVVASSDADLAAELASVLSDERFRVYTNPDVIGVELGGALKNVVALAAGMVDGLGFGDSAKAGIITRGLAEMTRLGVALGGQAATFAGLAGMGDLVLTCTGALSRNRAVGLAIGQGATLEQALAGKETVAEGVATARSARELAQREGVEMPIVETVNRILFEDYPPRNSVISLMSRELRAERDA
jgi:glycerol-3-phosphate dehydrogenase (NAD(P)+)